MIVVAGAGGFLGGHLVAALVRGGHAVRAVDGKPLGTWFQRSDAAESVVADLRSGPAAARAVAGGHSVYNLAADMGGIGYITGHRARCTLSAITNAHLLEASRDEGVERFFFASSACVYPQSRQEETNPPALREEDAFPADPEPGYGEAKLFAERMCRYFAEDFGLETRVARFHSVYGPCGEWRGGREKAPAAICRKLAEAERSGEREIEVWGDGRQTRTFMYVDDCVEGILRLMASDVSEPVNVGSSELVTVDELIAAVERTAGFEVTRRYDPRATQGVRGRSPDNGLIRRRLGWEPSIPLADGIGRTYAWVRAQVAAATGG